MKKILGKRNDRVGKVEETIWEHAKEILQVKQDIAKMNSGDTTERTVRRRKVMEIDVGEKCKGQWPPSFVTLNGWVV